MDNGKTNSSCCNLKGLEMQADMQLFQTNNILETRGIRAKEKLSEKCLLVIHTMHLNL